MVCFIFLSYKIILSCNILFRGAVFPYLASWTLYQGDALMKVLNWAGLVINGSVAFILPLILCSYFYYNKTRHQPDKHDVEMSHTRLPKHLDENDNDNQNQNQNKYQTIEKVEEKSSPEDIEKSLPDCLIPYRWWIIHSIITLFVIMIVATIALDIITGSGP